MSVTIYGIRTCDTMRKAFAWLDAHGVEYRFHDYRAEGIAEADIARWCEAVGWEKLLNKSSTTFRALPDDAKAGLDHVTAVALMAAGPTMIKRPVLVSDDTVEVGFKPERYASLLAA